MNVSVDGACALEGLTFGQIVGAVPLVGTSLETLRRHDRRHRP